MHYVSELYTKLYFNKHVITGYFKPLIKKRKLVSAVSTQYNILSC